MFEENTYDVIMQRVMDRIPATVVKDEGSFLYTAGGPIAAEHNQMYAAMDMLLLESFVQTASMENLKIIGSAYGLTPHEATPAVWSAVVAPALMSTRVGTRFNCGDVNLVTTGRVSEGVWELTCETAGTVGNKLSYDLIPIEYVYGLESIELYELLESGSDEEDVEDFRSRLLFHLQKPATSGNVYNYIEWATSVEGVGAAKVFPTWDGPGTVKVVITDSDKKAASSALVNEVAAYIETVRPIGASVTVTSGTELTINVAANVVIASGYVLSTIQADFKNRLTEYLEENAFAVDYLSMSEVGKILKTTEGVLDYDYDSLRLNDSADNIDLSAEQIAVIGTVLLRVNS